MLIAIIATSEPVASFPFARLEYARVDFHWLFA
jgi:hypothetical protein